MKSPKQGVWNEETGYCGLCLAVLLIILLLDCDVDLRNLYPVTLSSLVCKFLFDFVEVREKFDASVCLIVVGGGLGTIATVLEWVPEEKKCCIVIFEGTLRAADYLASMS